ncbi:MAG: hypothetical protein IJ011_08180 [Clostridia bacterium]|nr:hypothetical protein [Clostridia bacterium]
MKKQRSEHIRLDIIMLALTFGIHTLIEILLSVNSILSSDILYLDTVFPDITATAQSVFEVIAMSVGFSIIAVAFFMGHKKTPYILIYAGATVYRRLLAVAITLLINGALELDDLLMSLSVLILDVALLGVAAIISHIFSKKYRKKLAMEQNASVLFDSKAPKTDIASIYPFKKIYGKDNLLQGCLLSLGILLSAVKIISRTLALFITAPDSILMTVGGYAGDILIVVISYAVSCLLLSWLYGKNEKRKAMRILYNKD